jgi:hypothetical protein
MEREIGGGEREKEKENSDGVCEREIYIYI